MKTKLLNRIFTILLLLIVVLSLSTCSSSKRSTSSKNSFRIPRKIIEAGDLPEQLRETSQNNVHYVQLYPDERPAGYVSDNDVTAAKEEVSTSSAEMTEIEKYVEEVVEDMVRNRVKPTYYHIVSGSFKNKVYADLFAGHLINIGYGNTYVRFFDNGFNRVIVQRYTNEVEARQYLQGYRADNPLYADAWLFYRKDLYDEPTAFLSD